MFYDQKSLLTFCKWPASTTSGVALREWLAGFDLASKPDDLTDAHVGTTS